MQEGGYTELRQGRFISVVVAFLIGCTVLLLGVGCAGTSSETSNKKKDQGSSPQATESEEEARCEGTRSYHIYTVFYRNGGSVDRSGSEEEVKKADMKAGQSAESWDVLTTNDLPGCPKGGLLSGTDKPDELSGRHGDDEVRGLGARDLLEAGPGSDILYGGDGDDFLGPAWKLEDDGEDVLYGGEGSDQLHAENGQRDKLYCGEGRDKYSADKDDYVDSSCEKKTRFGGSA